MNAIDPNLLSNISKAIEDDTLVLPTLPEVALRAREVANDPDSSVAAIAKVIALLGIHVPAQMSPFMNWWKFNLEAALGGDGKPLILISHAEHHSNELMWRETIADVKTIPPDDETTCMPVIDDG